MCEWWRNVKVENQGQRVRETEGKKAADSVGRRERLEKKSD